MKFETDFGLRESNARQRINQIFDDGSFEEFVPPSSRTTSPHLKNLGLPIAFDDGLVIGQGMIDGLLVYCASQEPGFMGGAVGEVHGAKLTGILERAALRKPAAVVLIFDTGGVRLHEANAGLISISEIQRAMFNARKAGVPLIVISAGANGIYGGIGIITKCCDYLIITEEGRLSVSGPEVIESQKGVEEFDSRDRALVWRTMGGKNRFLMKDAEAFVKDSAVEIRKILVNFFNKPVPLTYESLIKEHEQLKDRLIKYGFANDAVEIWEKMGIEMPSDIPSLDYEEFIKIAEVVRNHE
jgi:malonate decarboxylase beta subunit